VALLLGAAAFVAARKRKGDLFLPLVAVGLGLGGTALWVWLSASYLADYIPARERAVMDQLRKLYLAQEGFRKKCVVDQDEDGVGEFGLLYEMAGGEKVRCEGGLKDSSLSGKGFLSHTFRVISKYGYGEKYGYYFYVFLPGKDGWAEPVFDTHRAPLPGDRAVANNQERFWRAFAWPYSRDRSGRRVFYIDQSGVLYASDNRSQGYDGIAKMPQPWEVNDRSHRAPKSLEAPVAMIQEGCLPVHGGTWERVVKK
jgi:hypothetical protein